ncbi:ArgE/DapE family deacylase [Streptomyces sp. SID8361]|uniref:ArgE/DapE family deacylase n=1 Tax=Streptomyces sp. MnatMP-M27 TaxID=1839768 RepID=UPI000B88470E|nr:ArgE/DapE family deacylase [Streptomyces sp. MnatMP-M27]MYU10527.1 ArgE/DapE family deacylase [Streptomyces sp. SID8361]
MEGYLEVVELLRELVEIDSVNPDLAPDGGGETAIARHVHDWAVAQGLRSRIVDGGSGRPNILVGGGSAEPDAPRLLLCGHLDTVGVGGATDPFTPRIEGDRLYGRGAYDMKAGLAASLVACRDAERLGFPGEVLVAAVADEENASLGVQALLPGLRADAAIVTEPTELVIGVAHKGFVWTEIEVTGVAAHGSRPHLGVDAIVRTGPVLVALQELERSLARREHPLLGPGIVHAGLIQGGQEASTIPERCVLTIERRTIPGETVSDVEAEVERLLDRCRTADPALVARSRTLLHRPAMETSPKEPVALALGGAVRFVRGEDAEVAGMSYWADSAFLAAHGIPTVLFGPGGEGAHADIEWVSVQDTIDCARILTETARSLFASLTR